MIGTRHEYSFLIQMGKVKALTLLNNIVSILLKYLSIIFQELAFGYADPQIVGSIQATGESVFLNIHFDTVDDLD